MKRRDFARTIAAGTVGAAVGGAVLGREKLFGAREATATTAARRPLLLKLGCQSRSGTSQQNLEFLARHGVYYMNPGTGGGWNYDVIRGHQDDAAKYGITIEAYHLPLTSAGIDRVQTPNIMLGRSPERDREIERIQSMITDAGRAGVPRLMYNMTILPVLRTGRTIDPTRGNSSYSTWNMEEAYARGMDKEMTVAGEVDDDTLYERITYFLDRVLPVAEEYNVKLACHIPDPPAPVGYRGITRWNSPEIFAGIRRYAELYDSPSHGFNFCVGSTAEGLRNPATDIFPVIEYLGGRGQIFNVHFRNIKGGWGYFEEVYPDNGDMNFVQVLRALHNAGVDAMVQPDHVPQHEDPASSDQAFAFAYGYIRALLQMIETDEATG
jgi:mannonate dehydratase